MSYTLTPEQQEVMKEALRANKLAIDELTAQKLALEGALAGKPVRTDDFTIYSPRVIQAFTRGELAYQAFTGQMSRGSS